MDLLPVHTKSCTGHLENTGSLSYEDLLNINTYYSLYYSQKKKKIPFLNIVIGFVREVFMYWKAVHLIVADTGFPRF